MLKKILLGVLALIVVLVVVVALRPGTFHYERSLSMAAPVEVVVPHVVDFHQWAAWSPYEKRDPDTKKTYDGATTGVGAIYGWTGNSQVGEGKMTIEDVQTNTAVRIKLEFLKPFAATNTATFSFKPEGGSTTVTWAMDGSNNFMAKAAGLFMDMDKMIGSDFAAGLASMKTVVEAEVALKAEEAKKAAEMAAAAAAAAPADGTAPAVMPAMPAATAETK